MVCIDVWQDDATYKVKLPYAALQLMQEAKVDPGQLGINEGMRRMLSAIDMDSVMMRTRSGERGAMGTITEGSNKMVVGCYEV